jgi:hypothetical protein
MLVQDCVVLSLNDVSCVLKAVDFANELVDVHLLVSKVVHEVAYLLSHL